MLLPQLHDELVGAALRPRAAQRIRARARRAAAAALLALLIAAPAAHGSAAVRTPGAAVQPSPAAT